MVELWPRGWKRVGEKRGKVAELTGRSMSRSVGSGPTGVRQIDERRLAGTEVEDDPMAAMQGLRRSVARWGGRRCRGVASGHVGEARGRRWPRWCTSAVAGVFGERAEKGEEAVGE